jgi:hypothetical protein
MPPQALGVEPIPRAVFHRGRRSRCELATVGKRADFDYAGDFDPPIDFAKEADAAGAYVRMWVIPMTSPR